MAGWKVTIKIDGVDLRPFGAGRRNTKGLFAEAQNIRKATAECIAGVVAETFNWILFNSPQYTGNFVANMAVKSGSGYGNKFGDESGGDHFPHVYPIQPPQKIFARGSMDAINIAKRNNPNIVKNLTAHIVKQSGWMSGVTIYNKLSDAETVEKLTELNLRDENAGASHPMTKGEAYLNARVSKKIVYGSPEFHALRNTK